METRVFEAKLENLHGMLDFIKTHCNLQHLTTPMIEQVILAAEEALVNIISYSYQKVDKGLIELSCGRAKRNGITLIVKDSGVPFNVLENIPPERPNAKHKVEKTESSVGGYGIYILTGIMDAVEYQRINDKNVLTLTKYSS